MVHDVVSNLDEIVSSSRGVERTLLYFEFVLNPEEVHPADDQQEKGGQESPEVHGCRRCVVFSA